VVIFCHDAQEGWQIINVSETTDTDEKVDLIFGAPIPISETPPALLKLQQTIQGVLDRMDEDLFAAAEKLSQTGLDSPETRVILAELCQKHPYVIECGTVDQNLLHAMAAGDKETCMSIFRHYYADYLGIYSIQWADASGINRFGYPEENSLTNYDFHAQRTPASEKFLAVIEAREEVSFVFPLVEGSIARCFSVPLYADGQYRGILYTLYSALENVACQLSI